MRIGSRTASSVTAGWFAALALLVVLPRPATPAGDPDPAFDSDGLVRVGFGQGDDQYLAITTQSDGKTVSVGQTTSSNNSDWVIARNETDGSRDFYFGTFGWTSVHLSDQADVARAVLIQPSNQMIVVGGESNGQFAVMRFNPDGTPDATFGTAGIFRYGAVDGSQACVVRSMVMQGSQILLFGKIGTGTSAAAAMLRLNANGTLDGSFGGTGLVTTTILNYGEANAGTLQADGKIVVAGWTANGSGRRAVAVLRYSGSGVPDPLWGSAGKVTNFVGSGDSQANALNFLAASLQPARLAVVGETDGGATGKDGLVVMYALDGTGYPGFGIGGVRTYAVAAGDDAFTGIRPVVNAQGVPVRAFLSGRTRANNTGAFFDALAADIELAGGAPESAFDGDGYAVVSMTTLDDGAEAIELVEPNYVLLGGWRAQHIGNRDGALTRRLRSNGANDAGYYINGLWTADYGNAESQATDVVMLPGGNLLVAGMHTSETLDIALAKLTPWGALDPTFNYDGKLVANIGVADRVSAMVVQPDGRILVAGSSEVPAVQTFMLARFLPDGSWDNSFDADGWLVSPIDTRSFASGIVLQPDGKIVASGWVLAGSLSRLRVSRFLADGTPDVSFNGTGHRVQAFGTVASAANSVALQPDGKILTVGMSHDGAGAGLLVVRLNPDGTLDTSFGGTGFVRPAVNTTSSTGFRISVQPGGKILACGSSASGSVNSHTMVRFLADGTLDTTFDGDGIRIITLPGGYGQDLGMATDGFGRTLFVGAQDNNSPGASDWSLIRLNADGSSDGTWSGDGVSLVPRLQPINAYAKGVALDTGGNPVVVGQNAYLMSVMRFDGGPSVSAVPEPAVGAGLFVSRPWPNPALAHAALSFELAEAGAVRATVFDVAGRRVRGLASAERVAAGQHDITWDLRDDAGADVPAGVYLVQVESAGLSAVRRITVAR